MRPGDKEQKTMDRDPNTEHKRNACLAEPPSKPEFTLTQQLRVSLTMLLTLNTVLRTAVPYHGTLELSRLTTLSTVDAPPTTPTSRQHARRRVLLPRIGAV